MVVGITTLHRRIQNKDYEFHEMTGEAREKGRRKGTGRGTVRWNEPHQTNLYPGVITS
jgi:hypothetical protein